MDKFLKELLEKYSHELRNVFLEAIASINDEARIGEIAKAVENGDFERIVKILSVESAAFRELEAKIALAFEETGKTIAGTLPRAIDNFGIEYLFRFDVRNSRAENWLREHSSKLVTRITDDVREAVRNRLSDGMQAGSNPRVVALDIVGRVSPETGRRVGGIVGLTAQQERYVANARRQLASNDPEELAAYLTRERRDRRFDRYVTEAIKNGKRIDPTIAQKMVGRYSDKLLKLRGDTIGRTEMIATLNRAQWEAYNQAVEKGSLSYEAIKKEWDATGADGRTRDSHIILDGTIVALNEPFTSPATGALMMYPGDSGFRAPGQDIINCRCRVRYRVNFLRRRA